VASTYDVAKCPADENRVPLRSSRGFAALRKSKVSAALRHEDCTAGRSHGGRTRVTTARPLLLGADRSDT
jgi:hypothetical protein